MKTHTYGTTDNPSLMLLPGLGVSYEMFLPLIKMLEDRFYIIAIEVDGFILGEYTCFTSIDDQAGHAIAYVKEHLNGKLDCAYGLSMGGKILSRILERDEIAIGHAVMDAAPLLPLPGWLINPLRYYQCFNVWTCYHCTGFWKFVFHSHYYDVILDECRKVWPFGKGRAVMDGYKDIYTHKLESVTDTDIHFWHGSKESFVAKPQVKHLRQLHQDVHIEVFEGMNHGQLLADRPQDVASRIIDLIETE